MAYTAIAVVPANGLYIQKNLDLVITDIESGEERYLVHGFSDDGAPVDWRLYSKEEFDASWQFFGGEREGQFSLVVPKVPIT